MKRILIIFLVLTIGALNVNVVRAESFETSDGTYKLDFDINSLGYDSNNTKSTDQDGDYNLSGGIESFDVGTGNSASGYKMKTGLQPTFEANVPEVVLSNSDNGIGIYHKLLLTIDPNDNPITADGAQFAIQISKLSDFSTFNYINPSNFQADAVTNADLSVYYKPCAQTQSGGSDLTRWDCEGTSSITRYIFNLVPNTTYYVRAVAKNGDFTNSEPGPADSETTAGLIISLELSSNASSFGTLSTTAVTTASPLTTVTATTNAENGYTVEIKGQGSGSGTVSGLYSAIENKIISSLSADLATKIGQEAYGVQGVVITGSPTLNSIWAATQTHSVGQLLRTTQTFFSKTSPSLVTGDQVTSAYKSTISPGTPAAQDYTDSVTYTMSASF